MSLDFVRYLRLSRSFSQTSCKYYPFSSRSTCRLITASRSRTSSIPSLMICAAKLKYALVGLLFFSRLDCGLLDPLSDILLFILEQLKWLRWLWISQTTEGNSFNDLVSATKSAHRQTLFLNSLLYSSRLRCLAPTYCKGLNRLLFAILSSRTLRMISMDCKSLII